MKKVYIKKSLEECLTEAFKNNAIITSDGLSSDEFIFVRNAKAYYEDGGCLGSYSETCEFLSRSSWASRCDWFVIGYITLEEKAAIDKLDPSVWIRGRVKEEVENVLNLDEDQTEKER